MQIVLIPQNAYIWLQQAQALTIPEILIQNEVSMRNFHNFYRQKYCVRFLNINSVNFNAKYCHDRTCQARIDRQQ